MSVAKREAWMKSGAYLPPPMRDFHDQKDVFKSVHEMVERSREKRDGIDYTDGVGWVAAQVYSVDFFLWYMARHGYTLQRSRQRLEFQDLSATVASDKAKRSREMALAMGLTPLPELETPQNPAREGGLSAEPPLITPEIQHKDEGHG